MRAKTEQRLRALVEESFYGDRDEDALVDQMLTLVSYDDLSLSAFDVERVTMLWAIYHVHDQFGPETGVGMYLWAVVARIPGEWGNTTKYRGPR